jgi:hypothetical protein
MDKAEKIAHLKSTLSEMRPRYLQCQTKDFAKDSDCEEVVLRYRMTVLDLYREAKRR